MLLENKIALVTGAARGIGAECALTFAKNGAKTIFIVDLDEAKGEIMAESIRNYCECIFMKADVSREQDALSVFERIKSKCNHLDILMNVAGICSTQSIFDTKIKDWDKIMDVNLKSVLLFGREALKMMIDQKNGRIISMASISGQIGGIRTNPAYAVSKAGIICLTKSFAKAGAKFGVTCNALAPGIVDTEMTNDPDFHYKVDEIPMGRIGKTKDIADAALFLASELSGYITGQCIHVNGGMYM